MISAIFVDRPRLAIVISILITLAGAIALLAIPVAQFPDIVPPQVSVSTSYGGANAEVVEQTVAQVIEREMIGVSRMLYMRSISGNDGSYGLSVLSTLAPILKPTRSTCRTECSAPCRAYRPRCSRAA